ncbi:SPW repeat protein [Archangium violaceum]|uniref:SPW repeat domain-containing protein n=1 Tax=Archangium violaceum TaxID=83451 RepID=UPI00193B382E|nr:SPW repeat protein [Archangium violaceum]QRK05937.1 SPW repeat protein [Archangium violaceum]
MWPRVVETLLGLWLVLSPFIFRHPEGASGQWVNDLTCGVLTMTLALLSCWERTRHAHLGLLAVSAWLVGFGYFVGGYPSAPGYQNNIFVGLILVLFAIIPNEANKPPRPWRELHAQRARSRA